MKNHPKNFKQQTMQVAENCGYAIATLQAYTSQKGVTSTQISEAISRLEQNKISLDVMLTEFEKLTQARAA